MCPNAHQMCESGLSYRLGSTAVHVAFLMAILGFHQSKIAANGTASRRDDGATEGLPFSLRLPFYKTNYPEGFIICPAMYPKFILLHSCIHMNHNIWYERQSNL